MKMVLIRLAAALVVVCALSGCATTNGLGRDIERAAESIREVAD